jgi:nicotinate-nucleotide adenylyltransferase
MYRSAPVRFGSIRARTPLCSPGQRIGLLGGSFNPAHSAHLLVSRIAMQRLGLSRVWWLVTPGNPLKRTPDSASLAERTAQARDIARDNRIVITDFEKHLPTPFTAATLGFLRRRFPETKFVWLMGADCLVEFHRWRQWRSIFATMPVGVIDRPGSHLKALAGTAARAMGPRRLPQSHARCLANSPPPTWTYLTGPLSPLSSTALRAKRTKTSAGVAAKDATP